MNLVLFVGHGSGKISKKFLDAVCAARSKNFESKNLKDAEQFSKFIKKYNGEFEKIFVFPIYCEDGDLKRTFKIDLAIQVENVSKDYGNCFVHHGSQLGSILGDKLKTNLFLSQKNILCPKVIDDINYADKVFCNSRSGSHAKTFLLDCGRGIKNTNYNTELIDTSFNYKQDTYYACPRAMCIEGEITDIFLRFRNAKESNPNVHAGDTPMDYELQNFYYETKILPNLTKLKDFCFNAGAVFGLGFYGHDILLCSKTDRFYMAESSFKFDNIIMWKNKIKDMQPFVKHEKSVEQGIADAIAVFYSILEKKYK